MRFFVGWLIALAIGVPVALHFRSTMHIGAPPLVYHCPHGSYAVATWVPLSSPQGRGAQGTTEYDGWRRIAACASTLDAST